MQAVLFTDVANLRLYISSVWDPFLGPSRTITMQDIDLFSEVTANRQWIHTDHARAEKESPYGGIIAHGLFIFSLAPSLLVDHQYQVVGSNQFIVRGGEKFRFVSPVYPGQTVRARSRLVTVTAKPRGTVLTKEVEIWTTTGDKPAVTGIFHFQYF